MATLLSDYVWEGVSAEMTDTLPGLRDGHIFKQLDTGESYLRRNGTWQTVNLGLSQIKATKSGRITTDANGDYPVVFGTPFSDNNYAAQLSCVDPEIGAAVLPFKRNLTTDGFSIATRVLPTTVEVYMLSNIASDISGYKEMVDLEEFIPVSNNVITVNVGTTPTLIAVWATPFGYPGRTTIPIGGIDILVHTQKADKKNYYIIYALIFKRNLVGIETFIAKTENSSQNESSLMSQNKLTACVPVATELLDTDRLVIKIYGVLDKAAADVSVSFGAWETSSRFQFPTSPVPIGGIEVDWVAVRNYDP
jgi:hypothetical protein